MRKPVNHSRQLVETIGLTQSLFRLLCVSVIASREMTKQPPCDKHTRYGSLTVAHAHAQLNPTKALMRAEPSAAECHPFGSNSYCVNRQDKYESNIFLPLN